MVKEKLQNLISTSLKKIGIDDPKVEISYPIHTEHGDFSSNVALRYSKDLKKNPMELGKEILDLIEDADFIEKKELVKPGFINFFLSKNVLLKEMEKIIKIGKNYGNSKKNKGKKIVVEYSSPNIAKPFTIGHLRSTIIGDAIANLVEATGATVYRDNHVGDWGTQFGKLIYAIKKWGDEQEIEKSEEPIRVLVDLYVKFHEEAEKNPQIDNEARKYFQLLESGNAEMRKLWEKCVDWSWKEFDVIYNKLGVRFTENAGRGYGESFFEDKLSDVIAELKKKKLLKESEGAQLVFFSGDKYPPLMILKKDGVSLYSTRDLATDKFRMEKYGKNAIVINEVGAEQILYFRQLFETEKMLGWFNKDQRIHVAHGLYRFRDKKMSTRKGNTIWLEDVLKEAEKRASALEKKITGNAPLIALNSLKWNDLRRSPQLDVIFDWDEILNMEGNSGPYVLYTYVRTQSILNQADSKEKANGQVEINDEELQILRSLNRFQEVVENAAVNYLPSTLVTYLYELARSYSLFYQNHPVLKSEGAQRQLRIGLTQATGIVLRNGLNLLGIKTVEKM